MSATQSWFAPVGTTSFARFGKIGPSWSLSVVATKRLRGRTLSPCSRISRITFLWLARQSVATADRVALGETVEGLAGKIFLRHLALEIDRIAAVLLHGLSPRKPGPD